MIYSCMKGKYIYLTILPTPTSFQAIKNTLFSGNGGDKKNLHLGGPKFIFLIHFLEIFSFLLQIFLLFLYSSFSLLVSFLKFTMYILIQIRLCGWVSDQPIFGNKTTFFFGLSSTSVIIQNRKTQHFLMFAIFLNC